MMEFLVQYFPIVIIFSYCGLLYIFLLLDMWMKKRQMIEHVAVNDRIIWHYDMGLKETIVIKQAWSPCPYNDV